MPSPPTANKTLTFLFTDIEGSTRLWEQNTEAMRVALARHDEILRRSIEENGGTVFKTIGDAFHASFAMPASGLAAAAAAQRALLDEKLPEIGPLRVRMALHAGESEQRDQDYFGPTLNRIARILSAGHGGQTLVSQTIYELMREFMPPGLSLLDLGSHRLKDLGQPEHLWQMVSDGLPSQFPPLRTLQARANNIPLQLDSFVGRESIMKSVEDLLTRRRLVTLTGSGGCGKTRLAVQLAADVIDDYANGVWLVELGAINDPALVTQQIATALGVREEAGRALPDSLAEYLRSKALLLILDNCEHLIDECAKVATSLLRSAADIKILATSREALNVSGEQAFLVPSMSQPDLKQSRIVGDSLLEFDSVRLFVARAQSAGGRFVLTSKNAGSVASVCRRLEGIPLAIELAAARVRALPIEEVEKLMDRKFDLLTGGSRTASPRLQTLQATIDWSYDLLTEAERQLLRSLSIFSGGWTLEAASKICADETIDSLMVLNLLTRLVDKSLVQMNETPQGARYRLLETLRDYSSRLLKKTDKGPVLQHRHQDYFLNWTKEIDPLTHGPDGAAWLSRLEAEQDNLRAAIDSAHMDPERREVELALLHELWMSWLHLGHVTEARMRLMSAIDRPEPAPVGLLASAKYAAAALAYWMADYAAAKSLIESSLEDYRSAGSSQGLLSALNLMGLVLKDQGDNAGARKLFVQSLDMATDAGEDRAIANANTNLGNIALEDGDLEDAEAYYQKAYEIDSREGNPADEALLLMNRSNIAMVREDWDAALNLLERSVQIYRAIGERSAISRVLSNLGIVRVEKNQYDGAREALREAFHLSLETGDRLVTAYTLEGFGNLAHSLGRMVSAIEFWAAASGIRTEIGSPPERRERERQISRSEAVREILGQAQFEIAWSTGLSSSSESLISKLDRTEE